MQKRQPDWGTLATHGDEIIATVARGMLRRKAVAEAIPVETPKHYIERTADVYMIPMDAMRVFLIDIIGMTIHEPDDLERVHKATTVVNELLEI